MVSKISDKPHVICIPCPTQSHIKAMLKLAKLLNHSGFYVTFVNTEYNHRRFIKSGGPNSLDGLSDFRFETIPDGLENPEADVTQDVPTLCETVLKNLLGPFCDLIEKLNGDEEELGFPKVSCIVSDGFMAFSTIASERFGIPIALFFTISASAFMGFKHFDSLQEKGLTPLKDESYLTNGYLDTVINWIPGMKNIRLKDLPTFIRTTDSKDVMFQFIIKSLEKSTKASAIIIHTFDALEQDVLNAISSMYPNVYAIGPLELFMNQISQHSSLHSIGYSLWTEDTTCLKWLDSKPPNSVVYVNFGSITVMTSDQLVEFAWGLANSKHAFVWIIRPDLVIGEYAILPQEFIEETRERCVISSWCPQEEVLNHPSIRVFLTHSGWGSTIESLSAGVPMMCWPFFGDQQTNCRYTCKEWGVGMEIDNDVKRGEVEMLVREFMEGENGMKMKNKAMEWKELAQEATMPNGSSSLHFDELVNKILLKK